MAPNQKSFCKGSAVPMVFRSLRKFCVTAKEFAEMEEEGKAWAKAIEAASGGREAPSTFSLTLDGALKSAQSVLPGRPLLEQFSCLRRLSMAGVGLVSLAGFPSLRRLEKLILSHNCISGGLEHLVRAGLDSLRDLDLSGNQIQGLDDLQPLSQLNLTSLDLNSCPVAQGADYRSQVFGLMGCLRYLDGADAYGNLMFRDEEEDEAGDGDGDYEDEGDPGGDDNRGSYNSNYNYSYNYNYDYDSNGIGANPDNGEGQYGFECEEDEEEGYDGIEEAKGRGPTGRLGSFYGEEGLENVELLSEDEIYEAGHMGLSARGEIDVEGDNGRLRFGAEGVENDADEQGEEEEENYDTEYLVQPINKIEETEEGSDFESGKDQDGNDDEEDIEDDEQGSVENQKRSRDSDDDERPPKRR